MRLIDADALREEVSSWGMNDYEPSDFTDEIDRTPTIQPNRQTGEWIPVSERLPKIDAENGRKASDVVLVCLADEKIHMGFYFEDKKWRFCESGEEKEPFWKDVIAWQPLPEPYKEVNND